MKAIRVFPPTGQWATVAPELRQWLNDVVGKDHWNEVHVSFAVFVVFSNEADGMHFKMRFHDEYRLEGLDDEDTARLESYITG